MLQIRAMCDQIHHRGPDDEGFYVDNACGQQVSCALGMRRLSIIDLSGGHQPIANEDRSVWVVFNGEIYNYRELRSGVPESSDDIRRRVVRAREIQLERFRDGRERI